MLFYPHSIVAQWREDYLVNHKLQRPVLSLVVGILNAVLKA